MNVFRILVMLSIVLSAIACSRLWPAAMQSQAKTPQKSSSIFDFDLDTLGGYNLHLSKISQLARIAECDKLNTVNGVDSSNIGVRLHLAYVTSLTPECGGPQKALEIFELTSPNVTNRALSGFLSYQSELLKQINTESEQKSKHEEELNELEQRTQSLKTKLKQKDTELEELRAKLDALKSIEKTFHQRNGGSR